MKAPIAHILDLWLGVEMQDNVNKMQELRDNLDKRISPTFCLAKWQHTQIYLQTGQTHSCYHPAPHTIPKEGLLENPSQLHNTPHKKIERKEMLEGKRCEGCQYCWNVEDLGRDYVSDRMIKTGSIYTEERIKEIEDNPWDFDVNPEYIEIVFSNECNFKCGYCHPMASSSYYQEIKKHGPYDMVKNHRQDIDWFTAFQEEDNPYVDAWWKWWPEVKKTLNILRITGGEPLLHKSTYRLLDDLRENPAPHLNININSNLGMSSRHVYKMTESVNDLLQNKKIKDFELYTSIDTWNERAEYLRTGLNLKLFQKNMDIYAEETKCPINLMITFNALAVTTFKSLLEQILVWRERYHDIIIPTETHAQRRIRFDTPYLKEPLHYDMNILPKSEFMPYMTECLEFMKENLDDNDPKKFQQLEYEKFRRVHDYMAKTRYPKEKLDEGRKDFFNWFNEYDRRRNCNFLETFPEYEDFYNRCGRISRESSGSEIPVLQL